MLSVVEGFFVMMDNVVIVGGSIGVAGVIAIVSHEFGRMSVMKELNNGNCQVTCDNKIDL